MTISESYTDISKDHQPDSQWRDYKKISYINK